MASNRVDQRDATRVVVADEYDLPGDVEVCVSWPVGGEEIADAVNWRLLPVQTHGIEREEHDGQGFHRTYCTTCRASCPITQMGNCISIAKESILCLET